MSVSQPVTAQSGGRAFGPALRGVLLRGAERQFPHAVSERLDLMRALAASLVLWNHLRAALFVEYGRVLPRHDGLATRLVYFGTGFGHAAVVVFFVLSGLLISASVLRATHAGRWSWGWYASQRLTRLSVVLIPALLLGALWDLGGLALHGAAGTYTGQPGASFMGFAVADRLTPATLLGNALYLQEIVVPPFGSNAPLWSLSYEFWYYVLFPALLLAVLPGPLARRAACAAAAVAAGLFVGPAIRALFPIWMMGALVAVSPEPLRARPRLRAAALTAALLVLAATLALVRVDAFPGGLAADTALGLVFSALVWVVLQGGTAAAPAGVEPERRSLVGRFADFSFTLYLVHMPVVIFIAAALTRNGTARWQPSAAHLAMLVPLTAVILAYAWLVARFTEARTARARRWITRRIPALGGTRAPGSARTAV
jgi:peptidoglycan/LPS O-acetylase OafA/YrhL